MVEIVDSNSSCKGCLFENAWNKDQCTDCVMFSRYSPIGKLRVDTIYTATENVKQDALQSDGSTASYYTLPPNASQLQDLIASRNMNAQLGEIFRAAYRYGQPGHHSSRERDLRKIIFYAQAELERLAKYEQGKPI